MITGTGNIVLIPYNQHTKPLYQTVYNKLVGETAGELSDETGDEEMVYAVNDALKSATHHDVISGVEYIGVNIIMHVYYKERDFDANAWKRVINTIKPVLKYSTALWFMDTGTDHLMRIHSVVDGTYQYDDVAAIDLWNLYDDARKA
jgi:hypothetical protein